MYEFPRCRVAVSFPKPVETIQNRNLLVSVNGRASNCTIPITHLKHTFSVEWGSFVFIRIGDRAITTRNPDYESIYECDFQALPQNTNFESNGIEVSLTNEPGMLN